MAKLSARGRKELLRATKGTHVHAVMDDGYVLAKEKGGDWRNYSSVKPNLTLGEIARSYRDAGWTVGTLTAQGAYVVVTVAQAKRRAASREQGKARRAAEEREYMRKFGEGWYVRNRTTKSLLGNPWAANTGPFAHYEDAVESAWKTLRHYREMKFLYLLPVQVVHAESKRQAEAGCTNLHAYWENGYQKGPPVDLRQMPLPGVK